MVCEDGLRSSKSTESPTHQGSRKPFPKVEHLTQNPRWWWICRTLTTSSQTQILLKASLSYIFEDNDAVYKMITKGKGSKDETRVKNPESCTQLDFERDTWDHFLRQLKIMIFRFFLASIFLLNVKQSVISKRAQERTPKDDSAVTKPRPMKLVSRNLQSAKKTIPHDPSAFEQSEESRFLPSNWMYSRSWYMGRGDTSVTLIE